MRAHLQLKGEGKGIQGMEFWRKTSSHGRHILIRLGTGSRVELRKFRFKAQDSQQIPHLLCLIASKPQLSAAQGASKQSLSIMPPM